MKILILQTIIFIAAVTLTFNANAQSDYVITVKGDSIPCKISTPFIGRLKYKSDTMSAPEKIEPDVIKEYHFAEDQNIYRAVFINNNKNPAYLTVVEKGKISIYELVETVSSPHGSTTTTTWYLGKGSDYVKDFKSNGLYVGKTRGERKGDFADMLKDDKNVYDKFIADDKFSFDAIRNLVHLYNTGEQYKDLGPFNPLATDYIITQMNDTIRCRIKNDFFKGYFTFRENNKNDFIKIDGSYTSEYYYARENVTFKLITLPDNKKEFAKWLENGRVNLYELTTKNNTGKKDIIDYTWYLSKENGPLIPIKLNAKPGDDVRSHKDLLKAFINIISDNNDILKRFNEIRHADYNPANFDEVIQMCINSYNHQYLLTHPASK